MSSIWEHLVAAVYQRQQCGRAHDNQPIAKGNRLGGCQIGTISCGFQILSCRARNEKIGKEKTSMHWPIVLPAFLSIVLLLAAAWTDIATRVIPNTLVAGVAVLGIVTRLLIDPTASVRHRLRFPYWCSLCSCCCMRVECWVAAMSNWPLLSALGFHPSRPSGSSS